MKELVYSVKVATRDACLVAFSKPQTASEWVSGNRAVHNRAAACFAAGGGIFRKPALSTDQFKLKVISQSKLYIYTLNVSYYAGLLFSSIYCQ